MREMMDRIEEEKGRIKAERKTMIKDALLILIAAAVLTTFLLVWKGQITGQATLQTFESDISPVTESSVDRQLSFEPIPNFSAKVGEKVRFTVKANGDDIMFDDSTNLFNISEDGTFEFTPDEDDVGTHRIFVIIRNDKGQFYFQDFIVKIEE